MTRKLTIDGTCFRDASGRHVLLRGVNLGGDCKVPVAPNGHTHLPTDFSDHRTASFVGRPFPLAEADSHLERLAHWGFNCLRLLTTWEAVEHAGPGLHDQDYLDYLRAICIAAGRHGFFIFIDFHQDVWSRMTGGDGAPGWTFEAAGLDLTRFHEADAAHVMQHRYDHRLGGRQPAYPQMSWATNYRMPAAAIMWTLFFAGDTFAPHARVGDHSVEAFLQSHYLGAMRAVAERLADLDHVIGFDTLNEPGTGYIGHQLEAPLSRMGGPVWSALDGLAVASGLTRTLPVVPFGTRAATGVQVVNPAQVPIWLPGRSDPFREAGAWDIGPDGAAQALQPDYFAVHLGRRVDAEEDHMAPFFRAVATTVRAVRDDWLIFAEVDPFAASRGGRFPKDCPERTVNASHWYDLACLVTKTFDGERSVNILTGRAREGRQAIEDGYVEELGRIKAIGDALPGGAPTLIGEFGIPFDMNGAEAYGRWANGERTADVWARQTLALDLMYNALDRLLLNSTQWNYTASNRNDPMIGDGWNQEDLSIWSADQKTDPADPADPDSGGRAVAGFCRPFVRAAQGSILHQRFDSTTGRFIAEIAVDARVDRPTEIFVPVSDPGAVDIQTTGEAIAWAAPRILAIRASRPGNLVIHLQIKPTSTSTEECRTD